MRLSISLTDSHQSRQSSIILANVTTKYKYMTTDFVWLHRSWSSTYHFLDLILPNFA